MNRDDLIASLTKREREVAEKLVLGWRNKTIAESLGISVRTVDDHRAELYRKLDLSNAVQLIRLWYDLDAVDRMNKEIAA